MITSAGRSLGPARRTFVGAPPPGPDIFGASGPVPRVTFCPDKK